MATAYLNLLFDRLWRESIRENEFCGLAVISHIRIRKTGGINTKIAALIMCHTDFKRTKRLISAIFNRDLDVYVHVDKKSNISDFSLTRRECVYILPEELRVDVRWGKFSQVEAEIQLIKYATDNYDYDYYVLLSGYDYPIIPMCKFMSFLTRDTDMNYINLVRSKNYDNNGRSNNYDKRNDIYYPDFFLNRFFGTRIIRRSWVEITGGYNHTYKFFKRNHSTDLYYGSQWWCLTGTTIRWMLNHLEENPGFIDEFRHSCIPDESFFQTLFMKSPFKMQRSDYLHYVDWSEHNNSPKWLNMSDYERIKLSGKIFARKIADEELLYALDRNIGIWNR